MWAFRSTTWPQYGRSHQRISQCGGVPTEQQSDNRLRDLSRHRGRLGCLTSGVLACGVGLLLT